MQHHINQTELFKIAEVEQQDHLKHWLSKNGIKFKFTAKGKVWTTQKQLDDSFDSEGDELGDFHK